MATVIQSGNFGRLLEPGLRKLFFETYKEKPEQYSKFMNVQRSSKAVEVDARMGGFSMWNKKGTLDSTEYEGALPPEEKFYKHETFSKGFIIEKEMVDDEKFNTIAKYPKALARAARATIESLAASVLNESFTAKADNWKGEALIGDHQRLDGGTTTNYIGKLTLSEQNLEIAMKLASEQVDERGLKIQMTPDTLIIPRKLEFTAEKIVKSVHLPGTDYNDVNPMQGRFKIVVLDYIDPALENCWWLLDSTMNPLNWFWRERLNFKGYHTDFDTDAVKFKGRFRCSCGWTDHRGILGANPDPDSASGN